jgi:TonB family protein
MTVEGVFEKLAFVGGTAELADTTVNAVKQWRYTPSTKAGEPVDLDVYVGLRFDHGSVTSFVEPNLPYPTKPAKPRTEHKAKIFSIVTGMQTPRATYAPDPEYSQAARAIGLQGTVVLGVIIASDGTMGDVWVERRLGLGLDQKAVDTVRRWKFQPAMKDGEPVAVYAMIEVAFHLY